MSTINLISFRYILVPVLDNIITMTTQALLIALAFDVRLFWPFSSAYYCHWRFTSTATTWKGQGVWVDAPKGD